MREIYETLVVRLLVALAFVMIAYLGLSWTHWDFNPANWPAIDRFLTAIIVIAATVETTSGKE